VNERVGIADGMVDRTGAVFVALGHSLRLRIIDRLALVGSATPNELAEHFGESQQTFPSI
jgi:DNA-binding transcriptional ArsR family regulator